MCKLNISRLLGFCLLGVLLSLHVPFPCHAGGDARIEAEMKDPRHIVDPLRSALGDEEYNKAMKSGEYAYTGNLKCRLCHRDFFSGRKQDLHEHTFSKSIDAAFAAEAHCLPCHTTGYGSDSGFKGMNETPKLANVQCEGCHGPGSKHNAMNSKGGFLAGTDRPDILKKMCIACHDARWNRSFKDVEVSYKAYKMAEANAAVH